MSLPKQLEQVVNHFAQFPDTRAKLSELLEWGRSLSSLPDADKHERTRIMGCVANVYLITKLDHSGRLSYMGDADTLFIKGLLALLVRGLSGLTPREIVGLSSDFILATGIKQSLAPSRVNSFLNIFLQMQQDATNYLEDSQDLK
jgi:cysteine desulfuration protein SufE